MNPLIGKTIVAVYLADDKIAIRFDLEDGNQVIAKCDADCCSYTWIEGIELPALGLPALVTDAADLDMPDLGTPEDSECRQYYGFKIATDRGEIIIDYRNDSNGYYGGNLSWPADNHYGGVHGQNNSKEDWKQVAP